MSKRAVLLALGLMATTIAIAAPWAAKGSTATPSESPSVKIYSTSMAVSGSPTSSSIMWTQPAKTLGQLYLRMRTSTPGDPCTDNPGSVTGHYSLNGNQLGTITPTVQIGASFDPLTGSQGLGAPLFPGTYELDIVIDQSNLSSLCYGTIFRTQLAVETIGTG